VEEYLAWLRADDHNSVGAMIEVVASGMPPGLWAPVYGKLDADLASAMMSINAVKGVEIGEGMPPPLSPGARTPTRSLGRRAVFGSNRAGGIWGASPRAKTWWCALP
jgi:chorismate synthase